MTMIEETVRADASIDLRGEVCPHPVMLTLEQLDRMQTGQVLLVVADCPPALRSIPFEVVRHGHRVIGEPICDGPDIRILIEKTGERVADFPCCCNAKG
ncbi:TusA-related sulfurtransferase [Rhodoblastus acidophilus]|uniref:sulfurtransferase TusA family protein n=1 Tax=Rhodoblastus acidophilus TaxID=1074 RepID=UPI0022246871|nr:sulfurtransferase TusA family protein [Rhodoblastus acidophilus]MCW2285400.1 TusA-related sulfurtransferase [Rhodoblastus acidophilus]MCW2334351.1 TusA-related sulfurtransferase [Rhodoblastus acidophilus]